MSNERVGQAISSVGTLLGEDAYLFLEDDARHFISEAVMAAISTALLQSFLIGLLLGLRGQAQKLGEHLATRLAKDVESAVAGVSDTISGRAAAKDLKADVVSSIADIDRAGREARSQEIERYASASEAALIMALRDRGFTATAARRLASNVRRSALAAIES